MNNIKKIKDIKYLINEHYSDKEPLNESQQKSKECFNRYCDDIEKVLDKLDTLYNAIKQKRDNAQWDYNMTSESDPDVDPFDLFVLKGQICAYNDVLSLLESAEISPTINFNKKDE